MPNNKPNPTLTTYLTRLPQDHGLLDGYSFAVKDVFNLKGCRTGFGNPTWDSQQTNAEEDANCVAKLLHSGATCLGKTTLGEFCSGLEGKNPYYGMPINPNYPQLVPGGSSSGSGAAVASGEVDFGLGTDTGGSVRVPASCCGLFGMRPTHGRITLKGCLSLSDHLDTVGVMTRSITLLNQVMRVLLDTNLEHSSESKHITTILLVDDWLSQCAPEIAKATEDFANNTASANNLSIQHITSDKFNLESMRIDDVMRYLIANGMLKNLQPLLDKHGIEYGKDTHMNLSAMKAMDQALLEKSRQIQTAYTDHLEHLLQNSVICLPTMPQPPRERASVLNGTADPFDYKTIRPFLALSSVGQLPQLTVPCPGHDYSIGASLIGGRNTDLELIEQVQNMPGYN